MTPDAYAHCTALTGDQWAWEFLRRNRGYQADFRRFIALWKSLEADYGAPPHRDFQRWKQDPRAYGPLRGEDELAVDGGELCRGENDAVFLECWMGAKWGFHKFPLDPQRTAPGPEELAWRPPPQRTAPVDKTYRVDLSFDLSLPLPAQLDAAKFRLASRAAELRRGGFSAPMTVANQRARWTRMLQLLDAKRTLDEAETALLYDAQAMVRCGYREIPCLAGGGVCAK